MLITLICFDVQHFLADDGHCDGIFSGQYNQLTLFYNPKNRPFLKPTYEYATVEDHEVDYES
jgi:hypothetical protein